MDFFFQIFIVCVKFLKPEPITLGQKFLWKITSIYMLKIFHKIFFENLTISIPAFQTAKKIGLLNLPELSRLWLCANLYDSLAYARQFLTQKVQISI